MGSLEKCFGDRMAEFADGLDVENEEVKNDLSYFGLDHTH